MRTFPSLLSLSLLLACSSEAPVAPPAPTPGPAESPTTPPAATLDPPGTPSAAAGAPGAAPPPAGADPAAAAPVEDPNHPVRLVNIEPGQDKPYAEAAFACCKEASYEPIFTEYLALVSALSQDDLAAARPALTRARSAITTAKAAPEVDEPARKELEKIDQMLAAMEGAELATVRQGLGELSRVMIVFARARAGGSVALVETWCQTTNSSWLQAGQTVTNPYTGPQEPPCGAFR